MLIPPRTIAALFAALALGLGAAACGEERTVRAPEHGAAESEEHATGSETTAHEGEEAPAPGGEAELGEISEDLSKEPAIPKPEGDPPAELVVKDIVEGDGPALKQGQTATAHYVGVSWSTGQKFDASWDRGEPTPFPIAQGSVIDGWVQGLQGMKVGGRRELVIPPALGYGEQGSPPAIAPNETLVFVVDLKDVS